MDNSHMGHSKGKLKCGVRVVQRGADGPRDRVAVRPHDHPTRGQNMLPYPFERFCLP